MRGICEDSYSEGLLYVYLAQLNVAAQWQTVLFISFLFLLPAFFFQAWTKKGDSSRYRGTISKDTFQL